MPIIFVEEEVTQFELYMKKIPVMPNVAAKVLSYAGDQVSFKELEQTIMLDPGLTTKILKVANSALYSRQSEIKTLQMAISMLGFKNIKSLVLLVTASNMFKKQTVDTFYQIFWQHSLMSAFTAKSIALKLKQVQVAEDVFVAGLLHDIGKTAIYNAHPEQYSELIQQNNNALSGLTARETELFGINHKNIGSEILSKWCFPEIYVDSAREHGSFNVTSSHKTIIMVVSVADVFSTALINPEKWDDIQRKALPYFPHIHFPHEHMIYYREKYRDELFQDPLFLETKSLFSAK